MDVVVYRQPWQVQGIYTVSHINFAKKNTIISIYFKNIFFVANIFRLK